MDRPPAVNVKGVPATHTNVKYGPHERNALDIWLAPSDKPTPLVIYIHGGGWGHNVGLCQYGALGRALDGKGYEEILSHYYPGTKVRPLGYK